MTRGKIEGAVSGADPDDGFGVTEIKVGPEQSLHLVFNQNGRPVVPMWLGEEEKPTSLLFRKTNLTDREYGEKNRLRWLAKSCCRFINTGGSWDELRDTVHKLETFSHGVQFEPVIAGFHLIHTDYNSDGVFEHVFAADDCDHAIRWVEGEFFDVITLDDLHKEISNARIGPEGECDQNIGFATEDAGDTEALD